MSKDGEERGDGAPGDDAGATDVFGRPVEGDEAASGGEELSFADGGEMTLDAFERAVSDAIASKLGSAPRSERAKPPGSADEMVASVLAALTGRDAKSALEEVKTTLAAQAARDGMSSTEDAASTQRSEVGSRSRRGATDTTSEREGDAEDEADDNVIDLAAAREARTKPQAPPSDMSKQIGETLKATFGEFLAGQARERGAGGQLTLDADFLKQHGPKLLGNLFQGLAAALLPNVAAAKLGGDRPSDVDPRTLPPVDIDELEAIEARQRAAEAEADAGAAAEADAGADADAGAEADADAGADADADAGADADADAGEDADAGADADADAGADAAAEADAAADAGANAGAGADANAGAEPPTSTPDDKAPVNVRVDLGSLLGGLFRSFASRAGQPRTTAPKPPAPPKPPTATRPKLTAVPDAPDDDDTTDPEDDA